VLFLTVRKACQGGQAAAEDRFEVTTLRKGRVRAVMLGFGVGERAEGTGREQVGEMIEGVDEFPAPGAL